MRSGLTNGVNPNPSNSFVGLCDLMLLANYFVVLAPPSP